MGLPRGIPAASLKRIHLEAILFREDVFPRGIPAASLKRQTRGTTHERALESSAGNTRGLIEARHARATTGWRSRVFRGEYPRPH